MESSLGGLDGVEQRVSEVVTLAAGQAGHRDAAVHGHVHVVPVGHHLALGLGQAWGEGGKGGRGGGEGTTMDAQSTGWLQTLSSRPHFHHDHRPTTPEVKLAQPTVQPKQQPTARPTHPPSHPPSKQVNKQASKQASNQLTKQPQPTAKPRAQYTTSRRRVIEAPPPTCEAEHADLLEDEGPVTLGPPRDQRVVQLLPHVHDPLGHAAQLHTPLLKQGTVAQNLESQATERAQVITRLRL